VRKENHLNRIRNENRLCKSKNLQISDVEVIPVESDAISRKRSGDRIVARLDNRLSIREDPIIDLINRD
jgi:hypothetical protein